MSDLASAIPDLRRPFTAQAVGFKLQTNPKQYQDGNWSKGLVVVFMDSRLVAARLNAVCPGDWHDEFEPMFPAGQGAAGVVCRLTVHGQSRSDVGFESSVSTDMGLKGLYSDAFKRAAVKFGIGAYLYAMPKQYVPHTALKQTQGGKWRVPDQTLNNLRAEYSRNLAAMVDQFGTPLDHGDVEDAQGAEVDAAPEPLVSAEIIDEVIAQAKAAVAAGAEMAPLLDAVKAERKKTFPETVRAMSPEQVETFRSNLADLKAAA